MKIKYLSNALVVFTMSAVSASASHAQTVQTFESFVSCNASQATAVQNNLGTFAGINFFNHWTCYGYPEVSYIAHSGSNRIYTDLGTSSFAFVGGPVQFLGAWFSGGTSSSTPVTFRMYLGLNLVASSSALALTTPPAFLASGYNGFVDRVEVMSTAGYYVMDDITYNATITTTPEPGSAALVTLALAGVGMFARRRRKGA